MFIPSLIAAVRPSDKPWYWYVISFLLAIAAVIGIVWAGRVWREARGESDDDRGTTEDLLTPLVQAYQAGTMSEEEYRRVRASLGMPVPSVIPSEASPPAAPRREARPGTTADEAPGPT